MTTVQFYPERLARLVALYLTIQNVKFTPDILRTLQNHPKFPSLKAINDTLFPLGIDGLSLKFDTAAELLQLPTPYFLYFDKKQEQDFRLVTEHTETGFEVLNYRKQKSRFTNQTLEENWSGVVFLPIQSQTTNIPHFYKKQALHWLATYNLELFLGILSLLFLAIITFNAK